MMGCKSELTNIDDIRKAADWHTQPGRGGARARKNVDIGGKIESNTGSGPFFKNQIDQRSPGTSKRVKNTVLVAEWRYFVPGYCNVI